jgi:archaellum component FlaC
MEICQLHHDLVKRVDNQDEAISDLKEKYHELSKQQSNVDIKFDFISKAMQDIKTEVTKLAAQPAKRWESLINTAITVVVSSGIAAAIAFAFSKH